MSQYVFCLFVCAHASASITVFVLFVRALVCVGMQVCAIVSQRQVFDFFETDFISAFLLHSLFIAFVPPSFSSSHICWIFSVLSTSLKFIMKQSHGLLRLNIEGRGFICFVSSLCWVCCFVLFFLPPVYSSYCM